MLFDVVVTLFDAMWLYDVMRWYGDELLFFVFCSGMKFYEFKI